MLSDPKITTIDISTFHNSAAKELILFDVLIIARPGMLRDSLSALFGTMPEIKMVSATNDLDSAFEFVSKRQPMICIMDFSNQGEDKEQKIDHLKSIWPEMKTLVLVDTVEAKEVAEAHGFDKVVIKGSSVQQLTKIISDCIQESMADLEGNRQRNNNDRID
jgi:DNA-binding NarL/FixJ family response regulator